jgi:hypothetical protein
MRFGVMAAVARRKFSVSRHYAKPLGRCMPFLDSALNKRILLAFSQKIRKLKRKNRLSSLFCSVRFAHTTKRTPRQKMANAILWLCTPTTRQGKYVS